MSASTPVEITEEQALWFRARRGFLAGPGAEDPAAAARAAVGLQAQQLSSALLGLSQRVAGRPTAEALAGSVKIAPRRLVWTWGQRDTLHLYDAAADWADVVAARDQWASGSRRGGMPDEAVLAAGREVAAAAGEPFAKNAVHGILPAEYVASVASNASVARMEPIRFAATRVMWRLAQLGELCLAGSVGAERLYAAREAWFPDLAWPTGVDPVQAAARLTRRYLAAYGPAAAGDVAHFFGARVAEVRGWLAVLAAELTPIACAGRRGLWALTADVDDLRARPPRGRGWPARLLPAWDGLLMGHKDKSWIAPVAPERKSVWRPGSYVAATVLARGRIVAVWKHKVRRARLEIEIHPFSGWRESFADAVRDEAQAIATHFGLAEARVRQV